MASVRRLSAVMFTDMVGSTAAAQANEAAALQLRDEQVALVRPLFTAHQGREIKSLGDGFLAEFSSALRAVECALDIQQRLHERNAGSGVRPIHLRIGIHLGDVEERETDIIGDAVNIASRVESAAEPGGICVTGAVREQVRNKIADRFERLPPTALKGVQAPIEVFRIVLPWTVSEPDTHASGAAGIAVLPFTNISPDPNDEYFADGLTEELITVLSQLRDLRVISRTSVMLYRATPKSASQIGAELGVATILEGSVRKAGNRLRVTAQLIDARSDRHLWAQTYDRALDDVFAIQSELAQQVSNALKLELRASDRAGLRERPVIRTDSYLAYLRGRGLMRRLLTGATNPTDAAAEQFERAISLDDRNAAAYSGLADLHRYRVYASGGAARAESDRIGRQMAARALELDPNLAEAHASLGLIIWDDYEWEAAEKEYQIALSLNPSYSFAHCFYGVLLQDEGRAEEALRRHELAESADPLWTENLAFLVRLFSWLGRWDEARAKIEKLRGLEPDGEAHRTALAWYYAARPDAEAFGRVQDLFATADSKPRKLNIGDAIQRSLAGRTEEARIMLRELDRSSEPTPGDSLLAIAYAEAGDLDGCFRVMERAAGNHDLMIAPFRLAPRLENVRTDPRFQALLTKLNLGWSIA